MNQKNQVVNYKLINVNTCRDTDLIGFIYCLMIDLKSIDDGYNSIIQIDGINYNVNESVIDYLIEQIEEVRKDSYIILNGIKDRYIFHVKPFLMRQIKKYFKLALR